LSASSGDRDLVAGVHPYAIDEVGRGSGQFGVGICFGDRLSDFVGFPSDLAPDLLVAVAVGEEIVAVSDGVGRRGQGGICGVARGIGRQRAGGEPMADNQQTIGDD